MWTYPAVALSDSCNKSDGTKLTQKLTPVLSELSTGDKYIQKASLTQHLTKLYNITVYYTHMPISLFAFHWCFLSVKGMYELL